QLFAQSSVAGCFTMSLPDWQPKVGELAGKGGKYGAGVRIYRVCISTPTLRATSLPAAATLDDAPDPRGIPMRSVAASVLQALLVLVNVLAVLAFIVTAIYYAVGMGLVFGTSGPLTVFAKAVALLLGSVLVHELGHLLAGL